MNSLRLYFSLRIIDVSNFLQTIAVYLRFGVFEKEIRSGKRNLTEFYFEKLFKLLNDLSLRKVLSGGSAQTGDSCDCYCEGSLS